MTIQASSCVISYFNGLKVHSICYEAFLIVSSSHYLILCKKIVSIVNGFYFFISEDIIHYADL